jgi:hypothetical protein
MANLLCRFRCAARPRERSPLRRRVRHNHEQILGGPVRIPIAIVQTAAWLLAAWLLAGPGLAVAAPPSASTAFERDLPAHLVRAAQAGHRSELARLGARAGARGLRPLLGVEEPAATPPAREVRLAAVLAAPAAEDAWDLLAPLAVHAAGPDRLLAASAAASAAVIAVRLHRDWSGAHEAQESAPADLVGVQQRWLDVARDPGRWVDVRVLALETAVALGRVLHTLAGDVRQNAKGSPESQAGSVSGTSAGTGAGTGTSAGTSAGTGAGDGPGAEPAVFLAVFTVDAEPALRRAAYELLDPPLSDAQRALAARAVADDADAHVALAAAQALCGGLGFGDDPAPILAALDNDARVRLRALVSVGAHPPAARIDAGRCLAAIGDQPSRRALDALRISVPRDLRNLTPRVRRQSRRQDATP